MTHQDELQLLLTLGPATRDDPLAEALQRLSALPAQVRPTPSPRLAAWFDDPVDGRAGVAAANAAPRGFSAPAPVRRPRPSAGAPSRPRVLQLRPTTVTGWLASLGLGAGSLLLAGTAAVAAIGHVTGSSEPSPGHPHVIVNRHVGSSDPKDAHGSPPSPHPGSWSTGHPDDGAAPGEPGGSHDAGTGEPSIPAPPAPAPAPAPRDGSSEPGSGSRDSGSTDTDSGGQGTGDHAGSTGGGVSTGSGDGGTATSGGAGGTEPGTGGSTEPGTGGGTSPTDGGTSGGGASAPVDGGTPAAGTSPAPTPRI